MRILINTPRLIPQGGVANHYIGLKKYWTEDVLYNPIGKKGNKSGTGIYRLPFDIISFAIKIYSFHPDIIILNPSLYKSAIMRDMIFLWIAKILRQKVVVFFHGFDKKCIASLDLKFIAKSLSKCELIFVLANEFKEIIRSWGVAVPIYLTTTKVDDEMVSDFDINLRNGRVQSILFLARITKEKGIFIALDTFKLLKNRNYDFVMRIVGDGPELSSAKEYCVNRNIPDVLFLGSLSGKELEEEYKNADIYLFPTFHAEGMPTTVLEAMTFGLPVVTRPIGGICDFFENGKMGTLIDSFEPEDFAKAICSYANSPEYVRKISYLNYSYARTHFMASSVAKNIEDVLKTI